MTAGKKVEMSKRTLCSYGIIIALLCTGLAATAGPGWRYRAPHTAWPPNEWTGVEPETGTDPLDPRSWGTLRFAESCRDEFAPCGGFSEFTAPLARQRVILDGQLISGEWEDAAEFILHPGAGHGLSLYLKHDGSMLYVAAALTSTMVWQRGQYAQLMFEVPQTAADEPGPQHRLFRLTAHDHNETRRSVAAGRAGAWEPPPLRQEAGESRFTGSAGLGGDAGWRYLVFEFAVPLEEIGGAPGHLPPLLGFAVTVRREGTGPRIAGGIPAGRDTIAWPWLRTDQSRHGVLPMSHRPDWWQAVFPGTPPPGFEGLALPLVESPVTVDGRHDDAEWADAAALHYPIAGEQFMTLRLQADERHLYAAVTLRVARGMRADEQCSFYFDPTGEGGLRPREGHVGMRLHAGREDGHQAELLQFRDGDWQPLRGQRMQGAALQVDPYTTTYEIAVPWPRIRACRTAIPAMAVEVSYSLTTH